MKYHLYLFLLGLFFLPTLACGTLNTNTETTQGSGRIVKQTVNVRDFDQISLEASGDVYIEQGDSESLTIEADDNILPLLVSNVSANELRLDTKPNVSINPSKTIIYRVTVKNLESISLLGSGSFFVDTLQSKSMKISLFGAGDIKIKDLEADSLTMDLSGSGNITIEKVDVQKVDSDVKGSGDIKLNGKSTTQSISYSGSGNYLAGDLETILTDIIVPGSADITIWVDEELKIDVDGSSDIRYYGKPTVSQIGEGSGKVFSLGEK